MLHLRIISPPEVTERALAALGDRVGCTNVVVLTGAGHRPEGDLLLADVAREQLISAR